MTEAFFATAFEQARLALTDVIGKAELHLKPRTLTRTLARRTRARLKLLESIVRRLIVLLALSLAPSPDRVAPKRTKDQRSVTEIVEDVTATFPQLPVYRLNLLGRVTYYRMDSAGFPERLARRTGPALALPLMVHADALLRLLLAPERHAARLARRLRRERGQGMTRPLCPPLSGVHRLRPELGAISAGLPTMIVAAWDRGTDTS
ncbi:MAG: hypothetical protein R3C13_09205 [Hyphomonas sp.]|uniref:hypothetical protein n=1 Tax=Hyphomonas sp. TaxID=87 RepID=UPI0035293438